MRSLSEVWTEEHAVSDDKGLKISGDVASSSISLCVEAAYISTGVMNSPVHAGQSSKPRPVAASPRIPWQATTRSNLDTPARYLCRLYALVSMSRKLPTTSPRSTLLALAPCLTLADWVDLLCNTRVCWALVVRLSPNVRSIDHFLEVQ
jgi:hypothetical protein